jgi:hypothetical protein
MIRRKRRKRTRRRRTKRWRRRRPNRPNHHLLPLPSLNPQKNHQRTNNCHHNPNPRRLMKHPKTSNLQITAKALRAPQFPSNPYSHPSKNEQKVFTKDEKRETALKKAEEKRKEDEQKAIAAEAKNAQNDNDNKEKEQAAMTGPESSKPAGSS